MKRKPRTLYMHTLDGKPASFGWAKERAPSGKVRDVAYVYFVGRWQRAALARSLGQIKREQKLAIAAARGTDWSDPAHYGHVLVSIPAVPQEKNDNG